MKKLKLGTRTSKLALAQSTHVKNALESLHPGLEIELVGIQVSADETANTAKSNVPLWQLDGKNFFVKELDDALLEGRVDLTVHSLKDLSVERPDNIVTESVSKRENPRDIAIFRRSVLEKLRNDQPILLGTSSPRRICNTPDFLVKALPQLGKKPPIIEAKPIRGNIDSRLGRLHLSEGDDKYADGIVLAIAGIHRLYSDPQHQALLDDLLKDALFMVLPLTDCPTTPGQGALAIECREDDIETRKILHSLHDPVTAAHVTRERGILKLYGGGCHQKFGATSLDTSNFPDYLLYIKGEDKNGKVLDKIEWAGQPTCDQELPHFWNGVAVREKVVATDLALPSITSSTVFVAHSRAVSDKIASSLTNKTIWTSGSQSWFRLAAQGLWVQGCSEELGGDILKDNINLNFLKLPSLPSWQILTHDQTQNDWQGATITPTYSVSNIFDAEAAERLKTAQHIFWSSYSQYEMYKDYVPEICVHYCRAGKTAELLRKAGISALTVFPNNQVWQACLKQAA